MGWGARMQRGSSVGLSSIPPDQLLRRLTGLALCECRGQMNTALPWAVMCNCTSPCWLRIAQRHQGSPFAEVSPSLMMHSPQNTGLHKLHFPYLSSVIFLSCNIHVWSSHCNGEVQWQIALFFTANHIMLPTPIFSIPSHVSASPCERVCWILSFLLYHFTDTLVFLCLTVPELFLCIVLFLVSLFIYHRFGFWFWDCFLLNSPVLSSDCSSVYTFL